MNNLELYEKVRKVPETAQKTIKGGRLNGMTDINPMWRIKTLTEQFGACGLGWRVEIVKQWLDEGANEEITANIIVNLFVKYGDEWSGAIQGIGGSKFVARERDGLYTDDECYKKAYTDAISVACKSLGIGADVYWQGDTTKYTARQSYQQQEQHPNKKALADFLASQGAVLDDEQKYMVNQLVKDYFGGKKFADLTHDELATLFTHIQREVL